MTSVNGISRVIGVSGPPGAGKSTLANALASRTGGVHLDYDGYQQVTSQPIEEIVSLLADHDYDRLQVPHMVDDLDALKRGKTICHPLTGLAVQPREYIYFETPFGRRHRASGAYIDRLVWLDIPPDVALLRNLLCYAGQFSTGDGADFIRWLGTYLNNYNDHVRDMLLRQRELIRDTADLVVDATLSIGDQVDLVISELVQS